MAAGLRLVEVERLEDDQLTWLCGRAAEYNDAHNNLASDYATEQLRLHYVWSAVERLLEIIVLPTIADKDANRRYNRAGFLLTRATELTWSPSRHAARTVGARAVSWSAPWEASIEPVWGIGGYSDLTLTHPDGRHATLRVRSDADLSHTLPLLLSDPGPGATR